MIGAYLDAGEHELVEIQKRPISITLPYRDKVGQEHKEDCTISSFYNFFLELYGTRGQPQKTALYSKKANLPRRASPGLSVMTIEFCCEFLSQHTS
jgi:hypothetical protein